MKKILLVFTLITVLIFSMTVNCSAAEENIFTSELPDYVNYSGGAWFETFDSVLGRCTFICPIEFKDNIFGFELSSNGIPVDIINFSNSTIYGIIITSNGIQYSCRANRFSSIEYQTSGSYNTYVSLNPDVSSINNSNMLFITDDVNYINDTVTDYEKYFLFVFAFIGLCEFLSLSTNLLRRGRR